MKPMKLQALNQVLQDGLQVNGRFYHPFNTYSHKMGSKKIQGINPKPVFSKLLTFSDSENQIASDFDQRILETPQNTVCERDKNVQKILLKNQVLSHVTQIESESVEVHACSFNFDLKVSFNQTPVFRGVLQTPIQVFYKNYNFEIQQLSNLNNSTQRFKEIKRKQDPRPYFKQPGSYFVGISMTFQNTNNVHQSLFFLNLACFVEPFNARVWDEIISFCKKIGLWRKAFELSKTAFLFTLNPTYAQQYLQCGDKAKIMISELRGLLSSLKNPQRYEKAIVESARLEIKNRKVWRGILLANKFCIQSNYKPNLCYAIILLAKCLQNMGMLNAALLILKASMSKGIPKFQAYFTYIQIKLRENNGEITNEQINFLDNCIENLTLQTRYRLSICIAQILINSKRDKKKNYQYFIQKAVKLASKNCKGVGKERAMREIYFTVVTSFNLQIQNKLIELYKNDEHLIFLNNRKRFIEGERLIVHKFKNWKYYLHYALEQNANVLIQAFKDNNQGRIISEAIHVLRLTKRPLTMLNFWRQKIEEIPKSGQLWCEGGRIFADLGEIENAMKCFQNAIHFTPQFGDSFLELLKLLLILNDFAQINQLRKNFQISEPYYGNVLSFLLFNHRTNNHFKLSLRQVWNLATHEIKQVLYSKKNRHVPQLTACTSYNEAFRNPHSKKVREILFNSYEQMQNKTTKT